MQVGLTDKPIRKSMIDRLSTKVCIVFSVCSVTLSMACAGELLSTKALQDAYRRFCPANISALKEMLEDKNTKLQGSDMTAPEAAAEVPFMKCVYASDPLYLSLGNSDAVKEAEATIRKVGIEKFVDTQIGNAARVRKKYGIDAIYELANSKAGLSKDEIIILVAFANTKARSQSVIWVLSPRHLPKLLQSEGFR